MRELIETIDNMDAPTFLDWAPIILSVIAVAVAICVPSIIAKRQNKIAVFDKLFAAYSQLLTIRSFEQTIKDYRFCGSLFDIKSLRRRLCFDFMSCFGYLPDLNDCEESAEKAVAILRNVEAQASRIPLLISLNKSQYENCNKQLQVIFDLLFKITDWFIAFDPSKTEETGKYVKQFVDETEAFFKEYSGIIETELKL